MRSCVVGYLSGASASGSSGNLHHHSDGLSNRGSRCVACSKSPLNNMTDKLAFLKAPRFWALVIGAISVYLKLKGLIGEPEMALIATITGGFVVVGTYDRGVDKDAAAQVQTAQITNNTPIAQVLPPVTPEVIAPSMAPVDPDPKVVLRGQIEALMAQLQALNK